MAKDTRISNGSARAGLDTVTAKLNGGTFKIYDDGGSGIPTDVDAAPVGTLLGTLDLSATAYQPAIDANPGAIATANAISATTAVAAGTATYFRGHSSADVSETQGTVGVTAGQFDLVLDSVDFQVGGSITVSAATMTMPESQ